MLAEIAHERNELDRSEAYLRRALDLNLGDPVALAGYHNDLSIVAITRGDVHTARQYFDQALSTCRGDPARPMLIVTKHSVSLEEVAHRTSEVYAASHPEIGEDEIEVCNLLDEAFDQDEEATMIKALKLKEAEGNAHSNLGRLAVMAGDVELARQEYLQALSSYELLGFAAGEVRVFRALGDLESEAGNHKMASYHWSQALMAETAAKASSKQIN